MKILWSSKEILCQELLSATATKIVESSFSVEEKDPGGAGVVSIRIKGDALQFFPNETATKWLSSNECADGAFVSFENDQIHLHIIELKSKLNTQKWIKAKSQFKGMFLRATAICAVLGIKDFATVTCYIAYIEDAVTPHLLSNPVLLKRTLGEGKAVSRLQDWTDRTIAVSKNVSAKVVDIVRDIDGNSTLDLAA